MAELDKNFISHLLRPARWPFGMKYASCKLPRGQPFQVRLQSLLEASQPSAWSPLSGEVGPSPRGGLWAQAWSSPAEKEQPWSECLGRGVVTHPRGPRSVSLPALPCFCRPPSAPSPRVSHHHPAYLGVSQTSPPHADLTLFIGLVSGVTCSHVAHHPKT